MEHIKKEIPGIRGYYADDHGNIYSRWGRGAGGYKLVERLHLMSPLKSNKGYYFLSIKIGNGIYKRYGIHRLVCLAFKGLPPSSNYETSHLDGTRNNNVPDNLIWETHSENTKRKFLHGTHDRGYFNSRAKINKETLVKIKELLKTKK